MRPASLDIYILFHASYGGDTVFVFPFSSMADELVQHTDMFPDVDGAIQEMYRRLQVRASSTILNMFADRVKHIFPRNYFVTTPHGILMEIEQDHAEMDIMDTHLVYGRYFQILMFSGVEFISPNFEEYIEVTMTIPTDWMAMSEQEKEYEWETQIDTYYQCNMAAQHHNYTNPISYEQRYVEEKQ